MYVHASICIRVSECVCVRVSTCSSMYDLFQALHSQIVLLLEVLKNTISEQSMRVNSTVTSFCARAARLFLDPGEQLL